MSVAAALLTVALVAQGTPSQATDPIELVKQGRKLVTDGRLDEGIALYDRALAANPDLVDAHLGAGIALDLKGQFVPARRHLSRALELASADERPQMLSALAVSYAFENKAREASTFYKRLLDAQTTTSDYAGAAATANALGRVYLETNDLTEARKWYESGYEYARRQPEPESPGAQMKLWEFRWLHARGRMAARSGRKDEAARIVTEARNLVQTTSALKDELPTLQYLAGYVALYAKDYNGALAALESADQRDPFVLALLAQAYEGKGDAAKARETWERVLNSRAHNLQNAFARPKAMKALGQ
jgi:tetratricopeptide (TPR) repeat protein